MTQPAQPEYFLVTRKELDLIKNDCEYPERQFCDGCEYADGEDDTRASGLGCNFEGANAVMDRVLSRPAPAAEPKFDSTDLLILAHDEWKRREERKRIHDETTWCAGFINGFLTDKKWARNLVDKMNKDAESLRSTPTGQEEVS